MDLQLIIVIAIGLMVLVWVVKRVQRMFCSSRKDYCQQCDDECCPYRRKPHKE